MEESRFHERIAVVTGAGSGLGEATAVRLAREGADVACLDLSADAAGATAERIRDAGHRARPLTVDVSDPAAVTEAVAHVARELGPPRVLVNCAGIGSFEHTHEVPFAQWQRVIAVNLTGTFLMCQAVLPYMIDRGGAIVNVASNAGLHGIAYGAAYCASKGGVVQLTRALSEEYVDRAVRVNAIAPGGIETPLQAAFRLPKDGDRAKLAKIRSALGNSTPEEVAALIAFVASDEGRTMTGAILSMDGGITA